jgi:hypothetical protein
VLKVECAKANGEALRGRVQKRRDLIGSTNIRRGSHPGSL